MPVTSSGLLRQVHFSGETDCPSFRPHPLKANFCVECSKLFNKHRPEAIPDDACLLKALEYSQSGEKVPSCILTLGQPPGWGGLYHGGFKAVMNADFLRRENVTHVVNTAKGLEIFGPKYLIKAGLSSSVRLQAAVETARKELGVAFLEMDWEDTTEFDIPASDFARCAQFIHLARSKGGTVLVHCAQGKSRSATAVISYIMASQGKSFEDSLSLVQAQRKMAEPNPTFTETLKRFEKSDVLRELREELSCSTSS